MTGSEQLRLRVAVLAQAATHERRLTLRDVGAETGVAHSTVSRLLKGENVDLETLVALARWAGHDLAVLPRDHGPTRTDYENLLGCVELYVDWRHVTEQLTTPQKELFADAVEAWTARLNESGDEPGHLADRWWRTP